MHDVKGRVEIHMDRLEKQGPKNVATFRLFFYLSIYLRNVTSCFQIACLQYNIALEIMRTWLAFRASAANLDELVVGERVTKRCTGTGLLICQEKMETNNHYSEQTSLIYNRKHAKQMTSPDRSLDI